MMLSFIITAFNRPEALRTCLSSLIQQTFKDWEAIVVDNSDRDKFRIFHLDMCNMDPFRIHYRFVGNDTKVTDAMHAHSLYKATEIGVTMTSGKWLAFPNDDSYYCPWYAERMLFAAGHRDLELVYCDLVAGGAGGHYLLQAEPKLCQIDKTNFILKREWFTGFHQGYGMNYVQADGMMIEELVKRGIRHGRVAQILCVHN